MAVKFQSGNGVNKPSRFRNGDKIRHFFVHYEIVFTVIFSEVGQKS